MEHICASKLQYNVWDTLYVYLALLCVGHYVRVHTEFITRG